MFTKSDIGKYITATRGLDHRRDRLIQLLYKVPRTNFRDETISQLCASPSSDFSEEEMAIAILQDNTQSDLVWKLEAGDLILTQGA